MAKKTRSGCPGWAGSVRKSEQEANERERRAIFRSLKLRSREQQLQDEPQLRGFLVNRLVRYCILKFPQIGRVLAKSWSLSKILKSATALTAAARSELAATSEACLN